MAAKNLKTLFLQEDDKEENVETEAAPSSPKEKVSWNITVPYKLLE